MTKLSSDDVRNLARLARLRLTDSEVNSFQEEISKILAYVEMLGDVDTNGLEPTYQVTGLVNVMREDKVTDYGITQEELLKNAPASEQKYLKVKRMIG